MGLRATIQFLVLCIPGSLWSMGGDPSWPTAPLRFETILPENGASMRFIQQIYEDSQGFLWIGTQGALLRYDGLRFKVFKHRSNDPHSLSGNAIVAMIEDRHGKMWVATHFGGLDQYDRDHESFVHFQNNPHEPKSLGGTELHDMLIGQMGRLWVLSHHQLDCLNTDGFTHWPMLPDNADLPEGSMLTCFLEGKHQNLWVGTALHGLIRFNPKTGEKISYTPEPGNPNSLSGSTITTLFLDSRKKLWVGTANQGLCLYDEKSDSFIQYRHQPEGTEGLSSDAISAIEEDDQGRIWVGTRTGGLNIINPRTGDIQQVRSDPGDPYSLKSDHIQTLYFDKAGIMWLGISGTGLQKCKPNTRRFQHFRYGERYNGLADNMTRAVLVDENQTLWVGTESGLSRMDKDSHSFRHYHHDPENPNSLSHNRITALYEDTDGTIWVATGNGLNRLIRETDSWVRQLENAEDASYLTDNIVSIAKDHGGNLWAGTRFNGLLKLQDGGVERFRHDPNNVESISAQEVYTLFVDGDKLWVGTALGLNVITGDRIERRYLSPERVKFVENSILFIQPQKNKPTSFWLGTGSGLVNYHKELGVISRIAEDGGLPGSIIFSALEDEQGYLWISSNGGLVRYHLKSHQTRVYGVDDGAQGYEFNRGAWFQDKRGALYFGGTDGLNVLWPELIKNDSRPPTVFITDLYLQNERIKIQPENPKALLKKSIAQTDTLYLDTNHPILTFDLAALHFSAPSGNRFAYRMDGLNSRWIETSAKQPFAVYARLPSGDFAFRVKAANSDGVWSKREAELAIKVAPAWWQTPWAAIFFVIALICLLIAYTHRQELNRRQLTQIVALKTRELKTQNMALETLDNIVKSINREVEPGKVAQVLIEQGLALFPKAHSGALLLFDQDSNCFRFVASAGFDAKNLANLRPGLEDVERRYILGREEREHGIYISHNFKKLPGIRSFQGYPIPQSLVAMTVFNGSSLAALFILENMTDPEGFRHADMQNLVRFREHAITALDKARIFENLVGAQKALVRAAYASGMAEIATDVLHNVGNLLNSVRTSIHVMQGAIEQKKWSSLLEKINGLLMENENQLPHFFQSSRAQLLPEALRSIAANYETRDKSLATEARRLEEHIQAITGVLQEQRRITREKLPLTTCEPNGLILSTLQLEAYLLKDKKIEVVQDLGVIPQIIADQSKLMRILIYLLKNAGEAIEASPMREEGCITIKTHVIGERVTIEMTDNGVGFEPEDVCRFFAHGYTTKPDFRGFGLHYCANTVNEMNGEITMTSQGPGKGATVTISFPKTTQTGGPIP